MERTNYFTNTYLDRFPFVQLVKIKSEHYKHNILGGLFTNSISKSTVQKSIGKDLDVIGCGLRDVLSHNLPGVTKQVKKNYRKSQHTSYINWICFATCFGWLTIYLTA
jgi:hypothetical protein